MCHNHSLFVNNIILSSLLFLVKFQENTLVQGAPGLYNISNYWGDTMRDKEKIDIPDSPTSDTRINPVEKISPNNYQGPKAVLKSMINTPTRDNIGADGQKQDEFN